MMGHATARTVMALVRVWCWVCFPVQIVRFRRVIGRWPDPALPRHRNDKYLWRKIFDRNPLFTEVSDKLLAKQFAVARCPTVKVPKTLWTGQAAEDIPDDFFCGATWWSRPITGRAGTSSSEMASTTGVN
jgi:hypothetical protein